jgi:hypothetical protein
MTLNDLHAGHFQQLVNSFGVGNALLQYRDDRLARAVGDSLATNKDE